MSDNPYLQFAGMTKQFPGVRALDDVSFGAEEGTVHAIIGENGAGKSTLLKILSGVHRPTAGTIVIDGQRREFTSTADALAAGIAVIYQELQLVGEISVAENLYIGHLPQRMGIVNSRRLREDAIKQLERIGEDIDPAAQTNTLPIGQRQMIEIAKALTRGAKIIAFDEPTSSLSDREVRRLFAVIRDLKQAGHVILYVSHRMEEVFEVCDKVTVLRDGKHVQTFEDTSSVTRETLVSRMVGRKWENVYSYEPREFGDTVFEVEGIEGPGITEPISFSVAAGEVLGIFGLVGAGRTELMHLLFGSRPRRAGTIRISGQLVPITSPTEAIRHGVALCPEDRKEQGIVPVRSVLENLNLSARPKNAHAGLVINERWERDNAQRQVDRLDIRTPSLQQQIMFLSGGNQQKVVLGRGLGQQISVLLLDEPTRGIDVGTRREMYDIMYELARSGVGIVMVSSDLPEVLGIADRIIVMRDGAVSACLDRDEATQEVVLDYALPQTNSPRADGAAPIGAKSPGDNH